MVDVETFLKSVKPRKKRSEIAPFYDDLLKLKANGCTLEVMREYLKQNKVQVSIAAISKYMQRRVIKDENSRIENQATKQEAKNESESINPSAKDLLKMTKPRD